MKTLSPLVNLAQTAAGRSAVALCSGALLFFAGCASEPESHVVSAPPPAGPPLAASTGTTASAPVVVQTPAPAAQATTSTGQTIVVTQAPPAAQTEPVLEQPSSRHVWIPGYWTYRDNRYVWIAGRWEIPPRTDAVWVAPRWERTGNAYRFYEGYWQ
jgi:hypothetical protein